MAILLVTETESHLTQLFDCSWRLAQARHEGLTVVILQEGAEASVTPIDLRAPGMDPVPNSISTLRRLAEAHPEPFDDDPETPPLFVRLVISSDYGAAVLEEAKRVEPSLVIVEESLEPDGAGSLSRHLVSNCHNGLLVTHGGLETLPKKILVPIVPGHQSGAALGVAHQLALESDGEVTALIVAVRSDPESSGEGELEDVIASVGLSDSPRVHRLTIEARSFAEGVEQSLGEHDALVHGAPERADKNGVLLDSLPAAVLHQTRGLFVAVVRRPRSLLQRLREGFDRMVHLWVPQMDRSHRRQIFEQLSEQAQWGFDFKMLMALSTSIASFGLIQNSTAVVIGAMLVAPLMTPMLCAGMALQQGARDLLVANAKAIMNGFFLALAVAFIVGVLSPIRILTDELVARGAPTLLDLGVALVSGFAAAYAFSRGEKLAAMLPGVAIAAALVPPIATTGVCLSLLEFGIATGAALLFFTNVVAIILGASLAFYSFGIRRRKSGAWVGRVLKGLIIALFALAIPLSFYQWGIMKQSSAGLSVELREVTESYPEYAFVSLHWVNNTLEVKLRGPATPPPALVKSLRRYAERRYGSDMTMLVLTENVIKSRPTSAREEYLGTAIEKAQRVVAQHPGFALLSLERKGGSVRVELRGSAPPSPALLQALRTVAHEQFGPGTPVNIDFDRRYRLN